ncbi:MAG: signal recognition particle-docking protein FtsY [Spirochaetales bacterium]|nr:signal recognition particle-docking protein FtsY [Spirochaetales bacterium]MCF7937138.1 signal recognition particle-docking protein FtsY [Spirochaetales bacterium]
MKKGLGAGLRRLFTKKNLDQSWFEEIEDLLIEADIGPATAVRLVERLKEESRANKIEQQEDLLEVLGEILDNIILQTREMPDPDDFTFYLILGVNGVGKTTSIAKLADYFREHAGTGEPVLIAGDTYRAAAIEQLVLHGDRLGLRVVRQNQGSDPAAVIYDGIESARSRGQSVVISDTAGRMHTRKNLVRELEKINKVVESRMNGGTYRKLLVLDATTGQNGIQQAETFRDAVGIDSVILAKYDSTAKGGLAVTLSDRLGIPVSFLGIGEEYSSIQPFRKEAYISELLGGS